MGARILVIASLLNCLCFALFRPIPASAQLADGPGVGSSLSEPTAAYRPSFLEPFNEKMFDFNLWLDEHMLRPVARVYARALPEKARVSVGRFFTNIGVIPRFANSLFQLKFAGAGREASRFVVNTTIGGLGFFDVAESRFGLTPSDEDFGQTLGHYGVGPGSYLVLPFFGPSTIRDTVGFVADGFMDPIPYVVSTTEAFAIGTGTTVANAINERSLTLELFEDVDRYALDLYSAVQDFYLQRQEQEIAK